MASQTVLALAALVCLAAIAMAHPLDDDVQFLTRERRAAARRGGIKFVGARTREAPVYASPEDDAADVQEEEEPEKPVKPNRSRSDEDDFAPPDYSKMKHKGATAIATSYSHGDGASSNSHATSYDGHFSGGMFRHRYSK